MSKKEEKIVLIMLDEITVREEGRNGYSFSSLGNFDGEFFNLPIER